MNKPIKFAIIGCGRVAGHHACNLAEFERGKLVAVCDLVKEKAQAFGEEFKVPFCLNYNEMLKSQDVDVVNIITPSGMHPTHAIDIIEKYRKHLVIEKPMFMNMKDKERLFEKAAEYNIKIFPVYQNRYNKAVKKVKEALAAGMFGKIVMGVVKVLWCRPQRYYDRDPWRGKWALDGGALTNQGIHYIDLLQWFLGEVEYVAAVGATKLVDIEVEDTGIAVLKFKSGAIGVIEVTTAVRPDDIEASVSVFGENGRAIIAGIAANKLIEWTLDDTSVDEYSVEFPTVYGFGHKDFLQDVVRELTEDIPHPISFEDGAKAVELLNAIYKAIETNSVVYMSECPASDNLGKPDQKLYDLYLTK